jgi:hypothetical protein
VNDRAKVYAAQLLVTGSVRGDSPRPEQRIVDLACSEGWRPWWPWDAPYRDWITGQRNYFFAWRMRRKAHQLYHDLEDK